MTDRERDAAMDDRAARTRLHEGQRGFMARLLPGHPERLSTLETSIYPGFHFGWRIAEAPALVPPNLFQRDLEEATRLLSPYFTDEFRSRYRDHVPDRFRRPDDSGWFPRFVATDYQRVWDDERSVFRLCVPEIQSFPGNLFLKPALLMTCLPALPELNESDAFLDPRFHCHEDYLAFLRLHILDGHRPEDTIVLEVRPDEQVTHVDMLLAARHLGCRIVDLRDITVDPGTHEPCYSRATVFDGSRPQVREFPRVQVARNILSRCLPDELDLEAADPKSGFSRDAADALFRDTIAYGTADWVVHPQDFFVLSKSTLVGNPHHHPPLRPLTRQLLEALERDGRPMDDGVLKPAYGAGGRGLLGLTAGVDEARVADLVPSDSEPDGMHLYLWQERYGADPVDRRAIEGYTPGAPECGDPVYHELRIMWAATGNPQDPTVRLVPLTGLTRWSRVGFAANARHQITPFTGTHGLLVADLG